jgi:hypothetical protein
MRPIKIMVMIGFAIPSKSECTHTMPGSQTRCPGRHVSYRYVAHEPVQHALILHYKSFGTPFGCCFSVIFAVLFFGRGVWMVLDGRGSWLARRLIDKWKGSRVRRWSVSTFPKRKGSKMEIILAKTRCSRSAVLVDPTKQTSWPYTNRPCPESHRFLPPLYLRRSWISCWVVQCIAPP